MKWRVPGQEKRKKTWERDSRKRLSGAWIEQEDAMDHNRWMKQIRDD